jgi:hypothetical protein
MLNPEAARKAYKELKAEFDELVATGKGFGSRHEYDWFNDRLRDLARWGKMGSDPVGFWHGRGSN